MLDTWVKTLYTQLHRVALDTVDHEKTAFFWNSGDHPTCNEHNSISCFVWDIFAFRVQGEIVITEKQDRATLTN